MRIVRAFIKRAIVIRISHLFAAADRNAIAVLDGGLVNEYPNAVNYCSLYRFRFVRSLEFSKFVYDFDYHPPIG